MSKPDLSLYIGRRVIDVSKGDEDWKWAIVLDGGVSIVNKSRDEVFAPDGLVGKRLDTIILGLQGTTLHFNIHSGPSNQVVGMHPTQYAIQDPMHGGEVYPQWPEELEEMGIPSHPDEEVSSQPSNEWPEEERKLQWQSQQRRESDAREFLAEEAPDEN
jgi:hypothetical protein